VAAELEELVDAGAAAFLRRAAATTTHARFVILVLDLGRRRATSLGA
jgi:uncharacterized ferredoxin-like protein